MSNWNVINKEPNAIAALVIMCQDYVLIDEEFMANEKVKKHMNSEMFWIELAQELNGKVNEKLQSEMEGEVESGYDDYEDSRVSDTAVLNYIMDPSNRFELNDMICETVDRWLKHFGHKRFR